MIALGILTGLMCAFSHSLCYLASKHHAVRHPDRSVALLLYAHLLMTGVSVPLVIVLLPSEWPPLIPLLGFLGGSTLFYLSGQGFMISSMRYTDPSRVSPLLGIKVILMGLFAWGMFGEQVSGQQWLALALCTLGAVSLGITGGMLPRRAASTIFLAATSYVLSDSCIERLVNHFATHGMPLFRAALFSLGLTYSLLAILTVLLTPWIGGFRAVTRNTRDVAPFAVFWIVAMAFYYVTLGLVGPVFGVVLQSTRGILSVFLGMAVLRLTRGTSLEQPLGRRVFLQRLGAALLMFLAITLYATG